MPPADRGPARKRACPEGPATNPFLDIEAVVDDDEEFANQEDEVDGDVDSFVDDRELEEDASISRRNLEKEVEQSSEFITHLIERYVHNQPNDSQMSQVSIEGHTRNTAAGQPGAGHLSQAFIERHSQTSQPPREDDWETWEVPVPVHSEGEVVCRILKRAIEPGLYIDAPPPRSAFTSAGIMGRVFIEARQWSDVAAICRGIKGVRWWETRFVTRADGMHYLNRKYEIFEPRPNNWIRLKFHPYMNDLAFIQRALPEDALEVVVVPRINYVKTGSDLPKSKRSRRDRPAARRFHVSNAMAASGPSSVQKDISAYYTYSGLRFDSSGYLLLKIDASQYYHVDVYPTVSQLAHFAHSVSIPTNVKMRSLRQAESRLLKKGDRVIVLASRPSTTHGTASEDEPSHAGHVGVVDEVLSSHAYVHFHTPDSDLPESAQILLHRLRRHYKVGDYVQVKAGEHIGTAGHIVNINRDSGEIMLYVLGPSNSQPTGHLEVPMDFVEFAEPDVALAKRPRRITSESASIMKDGCAVYENLPVVVIKGPLKGRSGMVKSVTIQRLAMVELRGSHSTSNRLEELPVDSLAFELDVRQWYKIGAQGEFEPVQQIPDHCSMLSTVIQEKDLTPEPDITPHSNDLDPWSINFLDRNMDPPAISPSYWLMKLPHRDSFKPLKMKISSHGAYEDGKWDETAGFYKGISGTNVLFFSEATGFRAIDHDYIKPVPPTKRWQYAHVLADGDDLGRRVRVEVFDEFHCEVVPHRGGRKGVTKTIATIDLAAIG